jgi:hypothetical protein
MTFRQQKPAHKVFRDMIYGLATIAAAVFVLAVSSPVNNSRHTALDDAALRLHMA